ncbi:MAG TPA: helix-turn-helix transcriptional regulator [Longimicrobiaceae bacterium]
MERREIKKLLIDLDLSVAEIARRVKLSRNTVYRYFNGGLRSRQQRRRIQLVLSSHGKARQVSVPELWPEP